MRAALTTHKLLNQGGTVARDVTAAHWKCISLKVCEVFKNLFDYFKVFMDTRNWKTFLGFFTFSEKHVCYVIFRWSSFSSCWSDLTSRQYTSRAHLSNANDIIGTFAFGWSFLLSNLFYINLANTGSFRRHGNEGWIVAVVTVVICGVRRATSTFFPSMRTGLTLW